MYQQNVQLIFCFYRNQIDYHRKVELGLIKPEEEPKTVDYYEGAPGQAPSKIKVEDLVTITSSVNTTDES